MEPCRHWEPYRAAPELVRPTHDGTTVALIGREVNPQGGGKILHILLDTQTVKLVR